MAKATKPLNAPKINDAFPGDKINANFKGLEVIKSFAKILPKNLVSIKWKMKKKKFSI